MKNFLNLIKRMFISLKGLMCNLFSTITSGSSFIITSIGSGAIIVSSAGLLILILLFLFLMSFVDLFTPGTYGRFIPQTEVC